MNNYKIKRQVKGQVHLKMKMYLPTPQADGTPGEVLQPAGHFWNFTAKQRRSLLLNDCSLRKLIMKDNTDSGTCAATSDRVLVAQQLQLRF